MKRKVDKQEETEAMEEGPEVALIEHESTAVSDIKGDEKNIAFLLFLYLLQGVPLGLCSAIPMILQNRGVSYKQQVNFCCCSSSVALVYCFSMCQQTESFKTKTKVCF